MTQSLTIEELERHEERLVLPAFDHRQAWRLGSLLATRALEENHAVAIDIRRPGLVLFRAALPGATADQEHWIRRKSALVLRFEASSALLSRRFAAAGRDPIGGGWLDPEEYTLSGGSFPVRVAGAGVVAAVTVSGLRQDEDHMLVVDGIAALLGVELG